MFAFIALLFVLLTIYFFTSNMEGFEGSYVIPKTVSVTPAIGPKQESKQDSKQDSKMSSVKPFDLPGQLPVAPYEQVAAMSPLPYQDTTLTKANFQQLKSVLELLKGFLSFEAQEISESSDPSVQ